MVKATETVTIVVPVYNTQKVFLSECVKSIYAQTYKNIQLLIIDDGSSDDCAKICDELILGGAFHSNVIHKKNGGVSSARNMGIEEAKGEYICFVDADDYIHPQFVELLISAIKRCNCDIAACELKNVYSQKNKSENVGEKEPIRYKVIENASIYTEAKGYVWNKIYKKEAIGSIRFDENFSFCEDGLFVGEIIAKLGKCAHINQQLYYYRINGAGTSANMSCEKYKQALYVMNKQTEDLFIKQDKELLSKRTSVREVYRVKYMVALVAEKPNNYISLLKQEKSAFLDAIEATGKTDSNLLKISQVILKFPLFIVKIYLQGLRILQKMKLYIKNIHWNDAIKKE